MTNNQIYLNPNNSQKFLLIKCESWTSLTQAVF